MHLERIIERLLEVPVDKRDTTRVVIDGGPCILVPTDSLHSYRGTYQDLAIGVAASQSIVSVSSFIKLLQSAIGTVYSGYKGGEYRMGPHTTVWLANYGEWTRALVSGVRIETGTVHLTWQR